MNPWIEITPAEWPQAEEPELPYFAELDQFYSDRVNETHE